MMIMMHICWELTQQMGPQWVLMEQCDIACSLGESESVLYRHAPANGTSEA